MEIIKADVAIAGAGVAGVTSAVSIGEKGYSVALFEFNDGFGPAVKPFTRPDPNSKAPPPGGVNGIFGVETEFQNSRHHITTKKEVYDFLLEHAHWDIDPRLVADFVNRSSEVYEWLVKDGLKIEIAVSYFKDAPFTWLFFDPNSPRLPEILGGRFKSLPDCTLYSNVEITGIQQKDRRVCGLKGVNTRGDEIIVEAKAVVMATGEPGSGMGPMSEQRKATSGIDMAVAIGAARGRDVLTGMAMVDGPIMQDNIGNTRQPTQLIVNTDAERFTSEEVLKYLDESALNFANQRDGTVYTIFDEGINEYHEKHGWFYFFYGRGPQRPTNNRAIFEQAIKEGVNCLYIADTVEELAGKMGLNSAVLKKTIDEYNEICKSGRDPLMKDSRFLLPLQKPPFYATRIKANVTSIPGPLRPNPRHQVLNTGLKPIPGLFAAGGCCSLINGELYTHRIAGSRSTYALVSGRITGESVPDYLKQNF